MNNSSALPRFATDLARTVTLALGLPFDLTRASYAHAVRLGFIENSLLKSARFERDLVHAEQRALGPWARQV